MRRLRRVPWASVLIGFFAVWAVAMWSLVAIHLHDGPPAHRAVVWMAGTLLVVWGALGGGISLGLRNPIRQWAQGLHLDWRLTFALMCVAMACLEEAITVSITNLAPLYGVAYGEAYITASGNYLDVILFHSVIVFIPMFIAWAFLLQRYAFTPGWVYILFGLTGVLAETMAFGPQNIAMTGFWVCVYGLVIYLPAYCIPDDRNAVPPRFRHYLFAIFFPPVCSAPVAFLVMWIHPTTIHFDPIQ